MSKSRQNLWPSRFFTVAEPNLGRKTIRTMTNLPFIKEIKKKTIIIHCPGFKLGMLGYV